MVSPRPDPELIIACLEWAGQVLLSMDIRSPKPTEYRAYWPEYAQNFHEAYGYTQEGLRNPIPRNSDIEIMDNIYRWLTFVSVDKPRYIIALRSLVTPISERYIYPWTAIAIKLHTDRYNIKRLHKKGVEEISNKLSITELKDVAIAITS